MLKILQVRLQHYRNRELPDVQAALRKGRGTRDQIANTHWIIEKAREFQKNIHFCFIDYTKAFSCVDHKNRGRFLEMAISDHLTCLLKPYVCQQATERTGHGTTDWFNIGKGVRQGTMLSPCLFNFYAELLLLFSHSNVSNSLQPHGLQHGRLPCPTLSPGVCSNSCPLSR